MKYDNLYWDKEIKFKEYADSFSVKLKNIGDNKPDCKVGNFGYNFYFRTNKGVKSQKYKNEATMLRAIIRTAKKNGLTYEAVVNII